MGPNLLITEKSNDAGRDSQTKKCRSLRSGALRIGGEGPGHQQTTQSCPYGYLLIMSSRQ